MGTTETADVRLLFARWLKERGRIHDFAGPSWETALPTPEPTPAGPPPNPDLERGC